MNRLFWFLVLSVKIGGILLVSLVSCSASAQTPDSVIDGRFVWGDKTKPPPTERIETAMNEILAGCPSKVIICVGVASGGHERDERIGPNVGDHAWARGRKDACVEAVNRLGGRAIGMPVGLQGVGGQSGRGFLAWCVPGQQPEPELYGNIVDEGGDEDSGLRNFRWSFPDRDDVVWSIPDWDAALEILERRVPPRVRVTGSLFVAGTGMYARDLRFIGGGAGAQVIIGIELTEEVDLLFRVWGLGWTTFEVVPESNAGLRAGGNVGISPDQHVDIWFGGSGCFSGSGAWSGTNFRCGSGDLGLTIRPFASLDGDLRGKGHIVLIDAMVGGGEVWSAMTDYAGPAVGWHAGIALDFQAMFAPETEE